jgi:hypothetical protein
MALWNPSLKNYGFVILEQILKKKIKKFLSWNYTMLVLHGWFHEEVYVLTLSYNIACDSLSFFFDLRGSIIVLA